MWPNFARLDAELDTLHERFDIWHETGVINPQVPPVEPSPEAQ